MRKFIILAASLLFLSQAALAQQATVKRSGNHTEIVIHNTSPDAYKARREQAERAQRRVDEKKQREHELELAKIKAGARDDVPRAERVAVAPAPAPVYRKPEYKPAHFMNGGYPTMGFGSYGFGSYNGFSYGYGLGSPGFGYGYGFGPVYRNRCGPRAVTYRGGGYRGGGRGGYRGGGRCR
jgi:hypothetical protein